jgi:hypothetical protein
MGVFVAATLSCTRPFRNQLTAGGNPPNTKAQDKENSR